MIRALKIAAVILLLAAAIPAATRGGTVLISASQTSVTVAPGGTVAIDLYITPVGGPTAVGLYDLTFSVTSSGPDPVTFTTPLSNQAMYDPNTTSGYIFYQNSSQTTYWTPSASSTPPSTSIDLNDIANSDVTISSKTLLGVLYLTLSSSAPIGGERANLSLNLATADVESLTNGPLTVRFGNAAGGALPEPSSSLLALLAIPSSALILRRSRRGKRA